MSICRLPLKATPLKVVPDGVHGPPPPPPELELATTEELLLVPALEEEAAVEEELLLVPALEEEATVEEELLPLLEDDVATAEEDETEGELVPSLEEDETEGELAPPPLEEDSAPEGLLLTSPFAELLLSSPASSLPLLSEEQEKINAMASETHAVNRKRVFFIICLFWFSL
jgi:hypothetical protein